MIRSTAVLRIRTGLRILGILGALATASTALVQAQCSNPANPVVAENCLTGTPSSVWDINGQGAGDPTIQGFTTDISVNVGGTIYFKIDTTASAYTIDIYRMGYYQGNGARHIASVTPSVKLPQSQPACVSDSTTGVTDCGNWAVSASWTVPSTAVSGIYFAHLIRTDTGGDSQIVFIVRNDASKADIMYQTSDTTWQAYNYYGNGSLYGPYGAWGLPYRTFGVSYNRPVLTRGFAQESASFAFGAEFAMVQWLEANGYNVTYSSAMDTDRYGSLLLNHKIFMSSGHDEYVSAGARANIVAARNAGVNLAYFSGNEVFWKTRFANSIDGTNTPYRTIMCYKETLAFAQIDPDDPPTWTGTWRDPTFSPPSDGGQPENALTGTLFMVNGTDTDNPGNLTIQVPQADGQMRFWRNTAVARLTSGATYTLVPGSLGYEWDVDADNGFRPAGAFRLSTSTYNLVTDYLLDYGATYGTGTATHHMMMYRAPSGALVFGAGTVDWAFGLNSQHDNPFGFTNPNPDVNMEQATVNLLADMGVQPATIQGGLSAASASTDTTPPHSVITSPLNGGSANTGSQITVTGTATDSGGGVVAGVEFSGDGGKTWHPANGRASWSYTWTPNTVGNITLQSRAVDDSGNLETPGAGINLTVAPQVCPCTIFGQTAPNHADSGDGNGIEVGLKFRADADGSILGVRFYKSAANTGTHLAHVWTDTGTLLGTATFSGETASGWQQVNFSSPIAATANTVYVVSYFAPKGHYAADTWAFEQAGVDNPPLHALANGVDGGDGIYTYTSSGAYPTTTFDSANYWVDVIYSSSNTYSISGNVSGLGGAGASVTLTGPENLNVATDSSGNFIFDGVVNGNYTVSLSNAGVSFTPPSQAVTVSYGSVSGINFTATVTNPLSISGTITGGAGATVTLAGAANLTATADASGGYSFTGLLGGSYTVTPSEPGYIFMPSTQPVTLTGSSATNVNFQGQACNCISIWPSTATPATVDSGDTSSVEVGVVFRADSPAYLVGVRFYKASTNVGTHVGHLWSSTGQLLGTASFPSETASGWQQGYFSSPVYINANTPYIVSYFAPQGHYSASSNYFGSSGMDSPPLHALANGVAGPNGLYLYSSTGGFPTSSYQATNYWVDVLYDAQTFSVSGTISGTGGAGATVTLNGNMTATTTADANGNFTFPSVYAGTYSVTPSLAGYVYLPGTQTISVSQANVTGVNFSVPSSCPCYTVWPAATVPSTIDSGDGSAIETGFKFQAENDGYILGLRFYKASANTGTHTANLWTLPTSGSGSLLSTANFANESPSGWQQVMFTTPVPVSANTPYVASYFAPVGHYSVNGAYFANGAITSTPLVALQNGTDGGNGVYTYSSASIYPSNSYNSDNYWVDVIYASTGTYTIAGTISGPGASGATLTLTGPTTATTTSSANGSFSFSGLPNGTYTVTPGEAGMTFTPATQTVVISGSHDLAANFSSALTGYPVSGTVTGGAGIAVTLSGATTQSTVADASGNFSFATVPAGTYTVTPAGPGIVVSPTNQTITVSSGPVTGVNFTASVVYYSISGNIAGGAGSVVNLSGASTASTTSDSNGNYSFSNVTLGTYIVTPAIKEGVAFNPGSQTVVLSGSNATGINFAVPANCPCDMIWPAAPTPTTPDWGDTHSVEVGVKFTASADAYITGLRFYKAATNTGAHLAHLWSSTGTLLGTATFANETTSGWQQAFFPAPIPVVANTTYVASYFAPAGHYAADANYFATAGVSTPPLQALANSPSIPNGVYVYTTTGAFPNSAGTGAVNYWVDVLYTPTSTYTVAGNISGSGGPGATVTLTGPTTASTTADASGNFAFTGLANGTYTVSPAQSGVVFNPSSQTAVINNAHALGLAFTSSTAYSISGTITGPAASGTTVTLSGASSATTTTNASGTYTFSGLTAGSYTVTPTKTGYIFTPSSQPVTISTANVAANFVSAVPTYTISGTLSGTGGSGATVRLTGTASATTTANTSGAYTFSGLAAGSYTVTPTKTGFAFIPASQSVTVTNANLTVNFASAATYTLSGTISGSGGPGATVSLTGAATSTTTASNSGTYSFTGLVAGSYTVTPTKTGYTFTPGSQAVTISTSNVTANFSSAVKTYTISGTITGAGAAGATVRLSGAASSSTTTGNSGTYTFTGLAPGQYTVTPSRTGFAYTPTSQSVTITTANVTANFSSAQTFSLSGTISGLGGPGATVTLSGAKSASTTANGFGAYSFAGLLSGTYTVTPSKTGHTYTPTTRSATISTSNVSGINFSSN